VSEVRLARVLLVGLVATGSLVVAAADPPPAAAAGASVLMVGDSTMRGMGTSAQATIRARYALTFDSGSCRRLIVASCKPIPNALAVIRANPGRDAIVIMTGYNDMTVGGAVDTIMAEAARQGVQWVVWLTYRTDIVEGAQRPIAISAIFRDHNRELTEKARQHPRLLVLDWDGYSAGRDDWFAWDGFHLSTAGGFALASYLTATLDSLNLARCRSSVGRGTPMGPPADLPPAAAAPTGLSIGAARRLVDTRASAPLAPGRAMAVSTAGIAAPGTSVLVNVGVVRPCGAGFVTAYACGAVPLASNVNFVRDVSVANLAAVRVNGTGHLCIYTSAQTDLIVDLVASSTADGLRFTPVAPRRLVDTRAAGGGALGRVGQLAPFVRLRFKVTGLAGVPADARAVALNVTSVAAAGAGYLTAYPCGPVPATSNLNFPAGRIVANLVVVPVAADGSVCLRSSAATHLLVDALGSFGPAGLRLRVETPRRIVDTRAGRGAPARPLTAGGRLRFTLPEPALLNVTAVSPSGDGFLTAYPCGPVPVVSTLNYRRWQAVPNLTTVAGGGQGCVATQQSAHVLVDRLGTFLP
jgi:hypothetical protein